jgi:ring-1,2-phenylacetyl-CoA epoxidase subunit PaaA/ring-1,2-phenylacetyl-CoA epoxidase subunit PaaC
MCRVGGEDLELLRERIQEMWSQAARWPGPDDDPGYRDAIERGMVSEGPAAIRDRVRRWLLGLLESQNATVELEEPADWSAWDPERRQ